MKRLSLLALAFAFSACGQTPTPAPPSATPAPESAAPTSTADAASTPESFAMVASWTDPHKLHEPMEANGDQMKALRSAIRAGDLAKALQQAELLAASLKDVRTLAQGFNGETPDRFRAFADSAAVAAEDLRSTLASATASAAATPVEPAVINVKLESLRASCKSCHDIYKTED